MAADVARLHHTSQQTRTIVRSRGSSSSRRAISRSGIQTAPLIVVGIGPTGLRTSTTRMPVDPSRSALGHFHRTGISAFLRPKEGKCLSNLSILAGHPRCSMQYYQDPYTLYQEPDMSSSGMPEPMAKRFGYAIKRAQHALRARMDETLRPLGLTAPQYAVLSAVELDAGISNASSGARRFRDTANDAGNSRQSRARKPCGPYGGSGARPHSAERTHPPGPDGFVAGPPAGDGCRTGHDHSDWRQTSREDHSPPPAVRRGADRTGQQTSGP